MDSLRLLTNEKNAGTSIHNPGDMEKLETLTLFCDTDQRLLLDENRTIELN